jgi:uncharacterized protein with von Willebrand factor type A (vWA) domain
MDSRSAFTAAIYGDMPLEYYMPGIELTGQLIRLHNVTPKFYQIQDLYLMYYQPYETVVQALKESSRSAWWAFIRGLIRNPKYYSINQITQGSMELSAAAAARTFTLVANRVETLSKKLENNTAGDPQKYAKTLEELTNVGEQAALEQVAEELQRYLEAKGEAEAAAAALAGHGYSLWDLSIWHFLQSPDEFRRRVKLLSAAAQALRLFSRVLPTSLSHQMSESDWGGIDGVTKMQSYAQLSQILPSELALAEASEALFAAKLAQMALMTYRHAAAVRPVVFVDKSGSMAESMPGDMPKISLAAGLALALYRKLQGIIYLFDTEVDKVEPRNVVRTLLTIKADGGTDANPVLDEIMRLGRRDYVYIIISDGITEASSETLNRFKASGLARQTRLIIVPPGEDSYNWVDVIRRHGRVVKATDIMEFINAVKQTLT